MYHPIIVERIAKIRIKEAMNDAEDYRLASQLVTDQSPKILNVVDHLIKVVASIFRLAFKSKIESV